MESIMEGKMRLNLFFGPLSRHYSVVYVLNSKTQSPIKPPQWLTITKRDRTGRIRPVYLRKNYNTYYLATNQHYTVNIKGKPTFTIKSSPSIYSVEKIIKK